MKIIKIVLWLIVFNIPQLSLAQQPIDTQITSGGIEVHLIKVTVRDDILTIYIMLSNRSDKEIKVNNFNVKEIQYISGGKRNLVLKDAENNWIVSPYGTYSLFSDFSKSGNVSVNSNSNIIGWMKFEAPPADAWPIELNLPQTLPFIIEKPN